MNFIHSFVDFSMAILWLRLILGITLFAHGAQKVFGWFHGYGLKTTVQFMHDQLHIPALFAYGAAFTELLGGIAVAAGLLTRISSLGLAVVMLVALVTVHIKKGFFSDKGGIEFTLALFAIALFIFLAGPGAYSVDALLFS
jgi:putative oxidoreductase